MKWLKIINFAIAALVALFFSPGVLGLQYEYGSTVTVNASRENAGKLPPPY